MSKAIVVYAVATAIFWLPAIMSVHRRMRDMRLGEQVLAGLLVAVGWPVTLPALGLGRVARHA